MLGLIFFPSFFLMLKNSLHLNVAACYLKMGECRKSIEACNKVCVGTLFKCLFSLYCEKKKPSSNLIEIIYFYEGYHSLGWGCVVLFKYLSDSKYMWSRSMVKFSSNFYPYIHTYIYIYIPFNNIFIFHKRRNNSCWAHHCLWRK